MKDRVPTYPGRVKLLPVPGQTNTYDMTMADEPIEAGTPPVKANLLKDATAALYGMGPKAVPDDIFAAIPGVIEPIGTVKVTVRKDLGENWALCNGDQYFPADVSQEFWDVASDPNVLYNGTLGKKDLTVEISPDYKWNTNASPQIQKIESLQDTGWYWFCNYYGTTCELYFSNDFFQTSKKIITTFNIADEPEVILYFKGAYYILTGNGDAYKLLGLDEPDSELSVIEIQSPSAVSNEFLGITENYIYFGAYTSGSKRNILYRITNIESSESALSTGFENRRFYHIYYDSSTGKTLICGGDLSSSKTYMLVGILNEQTLKISSEISHADSSGSVSGRTITKLIDGSFLVKDATVGKRFVLSGSALSFAGTTEYEFDIREQTSDANTYPLPERNINEEYILVTKGNGLIYVKYDQASGKFIVSNTNTNAKTANTNVHKYVLPWNNDRSEFAVSMVYNAQTSPKVEIQPVNKLPAIDLDKVYAYIRIR